jgi:zinc transporter ZupT
MLAAVKIILAAALACGTLIASFVETTHPQFVAVFWVAFGAGVIAAEAMRARRRRSIRWLAKSRDLQA